MSRIYNFSAGPAVLPSEVMAQVRDEIPNWQKTGASVMEISHRSKPFIKLAEESESDLRELLSIPENYAVLFLQGGASGQFAAVPMNLASPDQIADYAVTGSWGKKALQQAEAYCQVNVCADSKPNEYTSIPEFETWSTSSNAAYLHCTPNETIGGVEFHDFPDATAPLVADMSSTLLSRPIDVSRLGVIYAGAQKNIGPAGLTIVVVDKGLLGRARPDTPNIWNYELMAASDSMLNTPPTFAWYVAGLVFKWIKEGGGLSEMGKRNEAKASTLYSAIDGSNFYSNPVAPSARSWMNVPFVLADAELDARFLSQAESEGLSALKGHRSVGGMRASIYNAMPQEGVDALVGFMRHFERTQG